MGVMFSFLGLWDGQLVFAVLKGVMKSASMQRRRISGMLVVIWLAFVWERRFGRFRCDRGILV